MRYFQRQQSPDTSRRNRRKNRYRVDVALIQNSQNDVNRQQRGDDQYGLVGERILERRRGSLKAGVNGRGKIDRLPGIHNGRGRLAERDAGR